MTNYEEYMKNLKNNNNIKMEVGAYTHPLIHSIAGEYIRNRGKNLVISPVESNAESKKAPFHIVTTHNKRLSLTYSLPYSRDYSNTYNLDASVRKTSEEYGYVASSEYLYKMRADVYVPSITQVGMYLSQSFYKIPLFIENKKLENVTKISINGIDLQIDSVVSDAIYDEVTAKTEPFFNEAPDLVAPNRYQNEKGINTINWYSGRHLKYLVSNYTEFDTKGDKVKDINYSSMIWDTLCIATRNFSRHLTWNEWNDMRCAKSPYYPLPIQVTFEYDFDKTVESKALSDLGYNFIGYMVISTFRGTHHFQKPGLINNSMQARIPNYNATMGLENDSYLGTFNTLITIPRNVPSLIVTYRNGTTSKHEVKLAPTTWYNSDVQLDMNSMYNNAGDVLPLTPGVHSGAYKITADNGDNVRRDMIIERLKNLDMNAFLLPSERSVMEWHDGDLM